MSTWLAVAVHSMRRQRKRLIRVRKAAVAAAVAADAVATCLVSTDRVVAGASADRIAAAGPRPIRRDWGQLVAATWRVARTAVVVTASRHCCC